MQTQIEKKAKEMASIFLIVMGKEASAKIFKQLSEDEIEELALEISNVRRIDPNVQSQVIKEFNEAYMAQNYVMEGGVEYASEILEKAIGQERAYELIGKLTSTLQVKPFDFARKLDASQLLNTIGNEQPQTIALILSYLETKQAAAVLRALPEEIQSEVVAKIACMGKTSPEHIKEVERIFEKKLANTGISDYTKVGGIPTAVDILNSVDRSTEKYILENLSLEDYELSEEIKNKMFLFEDVVKLDSQSMQRVLKDISNDDLVIALKGVKENVSEFIFNNLSKRMQDMIKEEMSIKGPVKLVNVEEAQQKIVNLIRTLEEKGEIIITRGKEDELVG